MKRNGITQNTIGRERGRSLIAEGTMPSPVIVVKTATAHHPASVLRTEEQLITELSVD